MSAKWIDKKKREQGNKIYKLFKNCKLADGFSKDLRQAEVLVKGNIIEEIADKIDLKEIDSAENNIDIIDCDSNILAPGFVEFQAHIGEPGGSYKENLYETTKSAVAGGVTTINIMPDTKPAITSTAMVEFLKSREQEKAFCNVTIFGGITKNLEGSELSEYGLLKKAGIKGISDGMAYIEDSSIFYKACEYASNFDILIAHQPIDYSLSNGGVINHGRVATELGVQGIQDIAEKIALERDISIVEKTNAKYHYLNASSEICLSTLKNAKDKNLKISASTTPHHLLLNEEQAYGYRTFAKTYPPLRAESDRCSLVEAVKFGLIDFISCNNSPRAEDQKRLTLEEAEFGVVGLETLFSASYMALKGSGMTLNEIISKISSVPAKALGLENKAMIKKGYVADLILLDINEVYILNPDEFGGKAINSPFDGMEMQGRILKTYVDGKLAYDYYGK
jgi:dihydroorotase